MWNKNDQLVINDEGVYWRQRLLRLVGRLGSNLRALVCLVYLQCIDTTLTFTCHTVFSVVWVWRLSGPVRSTLMSWSPPHPHPPARLPTDYWLKVLGQIESLKVVHRKHVIDGGSSGAPAFSGGSSTDRCLCRWFLKRSLSWSLTEIFVRRLLWWKVSGYWPNVESLKITTSQKSQITCTRKVCVLFVL